MTNDTLLKITFSAFGNRNGSRVDLRDYCGNVYGEMTINAERWYRTNNKKAILLGYIRREYPEVEWFEASYIEIKQA